MTTVARRRFAYLPELVVALVLIVSPFVLPLISEYGLHTINRVPATWGYDVYARQRSKGLCPKCCYDRTGLAPTSICPECGMRSA